MKSFFSRFLLSSLAVMALAACDVPDVPTGPSEPAPSALPQGPACYQELECIVDTTRDNTLRRDAQEVINTLILAEQPEYNRICQAKADELTVQLPQCKKSQMAQP